MIADQSQIPVHVQLRLQKPLQSNFLYSSLAAKKQKNNNTDLSIDNGHLQIVDLSLSVAKGPCYDHQKRLNYLCETGGRDLYLLNSSSYGDHQQNVVPWPYIIQSCDHDRNQPVVLSW